MVIASGENVRGGAKKGGEKASIVVEQIPYVPCQVSSRLARAKAKAKGTYMNDIVLAVSMTMTWRTR